MVTTRSAKKLELEDQILEGQRWEMRRMDFESSESDEECGSMTSETVISQVSPNKKRKKPASNPKPNDRSKKCKVVPPKPQPSDPQDGSEATRPPAHGDIGKSILLPPGPVLVKQQLILLKAQCIVHNFLKKGFMPPKLNMDIAVGKICPTDDGKFFYVTPTTAAKSASAVPETNQEAEGPDEDRVGAKFASGSSENETEEFSGAGVRRRGSKSALVVSESDLEAEESDGDCSMHDGEKEKTPDIVPSKGCAKRRMKKSRETDEHVNPEVSSLPPHLPPAHRDTGKSILAENLPPSVPLFEKQQPMLLKAQCVEHNTCVKESLFGVTDLNVEKSARMDNSTGRLAETDFSSKQTEMPRSEDEVSNAVISDGQKRFLASEIPHSQALSELASSSGGLTKHAPFDKEGSARDCVGAKSASTVPGSGVSPTAAKSASAVPETNQESEGPDGDRVGDKSASTVSRSSENGTEESNGAGVRPKKAKSASVVSESDLEESDGDCSRLSRETDQHVNPEVSSLPPLLPYDDPFLTEDNSFRFDSFWKKGVVDQRLVDLRSFASASLGVEEILKDNHLLSTVTCVEPYVLEVVMEFYANLPGEETNRLAQTIFVRGHMYEFSPKLINSVLNLRGRNITRLKETSIDVDLDLIASTLTDGRVKVWEQMTPAYLSPRVAALHVMCCANWIPTSNRCTLSMDRAMFLYMLLQKTPFNYGKLAYDQIIRLGKMVDSKDMPVLPSLIYQVLKYQRDVPLREGESLSHLAKPICYHIRLSRGKHVSCPPPASGRKGKHASVPSASGRKGKQRSLSSASGRKGKQRSLSSNSSRKVKLKLKLKAYVEKAMAFLQSLEADETDDDEETETDDDDA